MNNSDDITFRRAELDDVKAIAELFRQTILAVNSRDYTSEQVRVWSAAADSKKIWQTKIQEQYFIVAGIKNLIVGFGSITKNGYLDFMYVHKYHQGQGIASGLLQNLENHAEGTGINEIHSDVSITARIFFEKSGYELIKEQRKIIQGVELINYRMKKSFAKS